MTRLDFEMEVKRVLREKGITQAEIIKTAWKWKQ